MLSKSVSIALRETGNKDVQETAHFCEMMNNYFDCTNVRSTIERIRKNEMIQPYTSGDDQRLTWLKDVFLKYSADWKKNITNREGNFSDGDRQKMFLST